MGFAGVRTSSIQFADRALPLLYDDENYLVKVLLPGTLIMIKVIRQGCQSIINAQR